MLIETFTYKHLQKPQTVDVSLSWYILKRNVLEDKVLGNKSFKNLSEST